MSTEAPPLTAVPDAPPDPPAETGGQLRLPKFEGYTIATVRIAFGGALELALTSQDDIALAKALSLGKEVVVTLTVPADGDGDERSLDLSGKCNRRMHRLRKEGESEQPVSDVRIVVNSITE